MSASAAPFLDYASPLERPEERRGGALGFVLFVILTAVLFIRPSEIVPALGTINIFAPMIIICVAASIPILFRQLMPTHLMAQPGLLCIIAMIPAVIVSNVAHNDFYSAREQGLPFIEAVLFYLLLTGVVNSPKRLSKFMAATCILICAIALLALLNY